MKPGDVNKYYWDSALFIAWVKNEDRLDPADMEGLSEVLQAVESGKARIITSVLWRAEALDSRLSKSERDQLVKAFDGRRIVELSIDQRIMELASQIRSYHRVSPEKDKMKTILVPDAIHLASAIHYGATEFHTFDGKKQDGAPSKLLTLDGNVCGHKLRICVPKSSSQQLPIVFKSSATGDIQMDAGAAD